VSDFTAQLASYKQRVDADIATYASHVHDSTQRQYGEYPTLVTDAFLDMLDRGGKRLRGALVMTGYEMCGGTDRDMIVRAATAIEMVHAYLLITDDIQDRSTVRRGKPTVHQMLSAYHREHKLGGDSTHAGISLGLNAAMSGLNAAYMLLNGLSVDPFLKSNAVGIVNHTLMVTSHGQTSDIMQEFTGKVSMADIENTMEWKTAYYTVLNPLCVGMVLAGVGCEDTDAIRDYALHTGKAFQITDDIIGVFGNEAQTGKSIMDDIREGKQTMLTVYAFAHCTNEDATFLHTCLGNEALTKQDFERCKAILTASGSRDYAEAQAAEHVQQALSALEQHAHRWKNERVAFLRDLAQSLTKRQK
jgi:geranylgeranyl diphosphate synthase type I